MDSQISNIKDLLSFIKKEIESSKDKTKINKKN